jgi:hypothetical protein
MPIGAEDQLLLVGRAEVLRFQRAAKRQVATVEHDPLRGQFGDTALVEKIRLVDP